MTKEQSSAAYIRAKLRDSNEYLGCEDNERKELIQRDLYNVQQAYEDGWDACLDEAITWIEDSVCEGVLDTKNLQEVIDSFRKSMNI